MKKSLIYSALFALPMLAGCNSSSSGDSDNGDGIYDREGEIASFLASPYLQYPATDAMTVMFEPHTKTGNSAESTVFYREHGSTGSYRAVTSHSSEYDALELVQRARIEGLKSDTKYDYFVRTPAGDSKVYNFRTWPDQSDMDKHQEYTFVAMSDTHASERDSWGEGLTGLRDIYQHGIIKHECLDDLSICNDLISGIIVAGDLVYSNRDTAYRDFFNSSLELAAYVPILPTPGNHEYDGTIESYDIYLDWPEQIGWDRARHTYTLDFLNLRMFFFNSFVGTQGGYEFQYDWTAEEMRHTAADADIDYVLGVTHAPCKSTMWLSGESDRACSFVDLIHDYSEESGKISGHMFGHTHAYTRGNAQDIPHVSLNVATSVGRIDHFSEFAQYDYDTVALSNDDNGYNILTLTTGDTKQITIERRNGGSFYRGIDNSFPVSDLKVVKIDNAPTQPNIERFEFVAHDEVLVDASAFESGNQTKHYESHWQVSKVADFSEDVIEAWGNATRAYNWWYNQDDFFDENGERIAWPCDPYAETCEEGKKHTYAVDTQAGVDITQFKLTPNAMPEDTLYARVRYRDEQLNWSEWSPVSSLLFAGETTENVVVNGDAEAGNTEGWTYFSKVEDGSDADGSEDALVSLHYSCSLTGNPLPAGHGNRLFLLGNRAYNDCHSHGYPFGGIAYQQFDVQELFPAYTGEQPIYADFSAYLMTWTAGPEIEVYAEYFGEDMQPMGKSERFISDERSKQTLGRYGHAELAPAGVRYIRVVIESYIGGGQDTDGMFDTVSLQIGMGG